MTKIFTTKNPRQFAGDFCISEFIILFLPFTKGGWEGFLKIHPPSFKKRGSILITNSEMGEVG